MRSYIDPPPTVLGIVRALLYILYPDNEFETWAKCKQVNSYNTALGYPFIIRSHLSVYSRELQAIVPGNYRLLLAMSIFSSVHQFTSVAR